MSTEVLKDIILGPEPYDIHPDYGFQAAAHDLGTFAIIMVH